MYINNIRTARIILHLILFPQFLNDLFHTVYTIYHKLNCFLTNQETKENLLEDLFLSVINKYYSTKAQSKRKRFCDSGVGFIHRVCCQVR